MIEGVLPFFAPLRFSDLIRSFAAKVPSVWHDGADLGLGLPPHAKLFLKIA